MGNLIVFVCGPNARVAVFVDVYHTGPWAWQVAIPHEVLVLVAISLWGSGVGPQQIAPIRSV